MTKIQTHFFAGKLGKITLHYKTEDLAQQNVGRGRSVQFAVCQQVGKVFGRGFRSLFEKAMCKTLG